MFAQCVLNGFGSPPAIPPGTNYVNVNSSGFPSLTPILNAIAAWNGGCGAATRHNGGNLPYAHFTVGSYAATYEINITLVVGHAGSPQAGTNPPEYPIATNDAAGDIVVYTVSGPVSAPHSSGVCSDATHCDNTALQYVLTHELGHTLNIADATSSSCSNDVMFGTANQVLTISSADCDTANEENETGEEETACQDISCEYSPIVIALFGTYRFTGLQDGVWFDVNGDGEPDYIGWTAPHSGVAFLWLDQNCDGVPDNGRELFGNATPYADGRAAANGFAALRQYDANGDDRIDELDPIWPALSLWVDANHDGLAQPGELMSLSAVGIVAIELPYFAAQRVDRFGNLLRWEGRIWRLGPDGRIRPESIYDVVFVHR